MLPDWALDESESDKVYTLPGFIFNLSSKKCKIIKPPMAPKLTGQVVTMGDLIYFMAQPFLGSHSPDPRFERYDTFTQKWEEQEPLPLLTPDYDSWTGLIQGSAVLDDTILVYMDGVHGPEMQAYNVGRNKWYSVEVSNNLCYNIVGEAVVVNKIIYALTALCRSVVALTLKSRDNDGDLVFTFDLHKEYKVPGMGQTKFDLWDSYQRTRHLVHLGKDNFCVVQSCNFDGVQNQYIQLTNIDLSEKKSIVTNICVHEFRLPDGVQFVIRQCFSMPKCKTTTALEHEAEIVTLPPELLQFQDKYSSQTNIIDEQGGSVSQSSQSRDDADTKTLQVQEDVPMKSSASMVAPKSNVPSKASNTDEEDVRPDPVLKCDDTNILFTCKVSYIDAILGTSMKVPTVDGMVDLKIPAGTQPGTTLVMAKKGVPLLNKNNMRGDQLVKVQVEIPKRLNSQEKKLIEQLANLNKAKATNSRR